MKQLTVEEFTEAFDPSVRARIRNVIEVSYPDAVAVVVFENVAFDSSEFGARSALPVGPSNTFKSVEFCEGKWLNDLPSQRQYPQGFIPAEALKSSNFGK